MSYAIKQSSTQSVLMFLMIQSSDHITGLTGATPTVVLSKNGAAFASPAGAVTEVGNGWYKVAGNSTDTNTLGPLALHATAASADPSDIIVAEIVAYDPQDAAALGLSMVPTNVKQVNAVATTSVTTINANFGTTQPINFTGTGATAYIKSDVIDFGGTGVTGRDIGASVLLSNGTGTGQVSLSSGAVTVGTNNDKTGYALTQAFPTNFSALLVSAGGHISNVDTLTTYTGNTPQTGDGYALLNGATTEPTSVPASTASRALKIDYLFVKTRNKSTQTATTQLIRNNGDTGTVATITVSDDGTTFTKGIDT